jgi:ferredoxin
MPTVRFVKNKKLVKEVYVAPGAVLRTAARANGVPIHHDLVEFINPFVEALGGCKGFGACGTCTVHVVQGAENLSPKSSFEKLRLGLGVMDIGHEEVTRLSCQTRVNGDCEVEVQPPFNFSGQKFWEEKPKAFSVHAGQDKPE